MGAAIFLPIILVVMGIGGAIADSIDKRKEDGCASYSDQSR